MKKIYLILVVCVLLACLMVISFGFERVFALEGGDNAGVGEGSGIGEGDPDGLEGAQADMDASEAAAEAEAEMDDAQGAIPGSGSSSSTSDFGDAALAAFADAETAAELESALATLANQDTLTSDVLADALASVQDLSFIPDQPTLNQQLDDIASEFQEENNLLSFDITDNIEITFHGDLPGLLNGVISGSAEVTITF